MNLVVEKKEYFSTKLKDSGVCFCPYCGKDLMSNSEYFPVPKFNVNDDSFLYEFLCCNKALKRTILTNPI